MENILINPINPAIIYHNAKELLMAGIVRACRWPVSAFDKNGNPVAIENQQAAYFTPSGAVIKALMNYCNSGNNLDEKATPYIEEIVKYFPETHIYKYELSTALDLVCLKKTDEEIISAFEGVIENITKNGGKL